ncbi:putative fungistatic metabolite [Colletotrichum siamense]|nr:putative fungistatic metabolite [Colletotrichum siamense]
MAPLLRAVAAFAAATTLVSQVTATTVELPPCLSAFQPFVYSGCYAEKGTQGENALDFRSSIDQSKTTTESCAAECKGNGYRYSGLTYYGVCYCSATVNSAKLDDSVCNYPCNGAKNETCGGPSAFSVWADPTFAKVDDTVIESFQSIGCYTDDTSHGRTVAERQDQIPTGSMTPSACIAACAADGYPFAGLEFGQECYCGVVIGNYSVPTTSDKCAMPCKGDSTKNCGGSANVEIYASQKLLSLEPCGYVPPANSPSSSLPVTLPVSSAPASSVPDTSVPATSAPASSVPDTSVPATSVPATSVPATSVPDTSVPATSVPATSVPATSVPTTSVPVVSTTSQAPPPPPPATTSTSICTTSTTKPVVPPVSTSKVVSSQAPPPPSTTPKPTPSTTAPAMCTTTVTTPATCEYGCGSWCNKNLPDFDDQDSCNKASNRCLLQVNACYKGAGFPNSAACVDFKAWCKDVSSYCSSSCSGKKGSCGKKDCFQKKQPKGWKPGSTSVSTFPCPSKPTSTSTPVTVVPPPPTGICKQPSSSSWFLKYGPGNPVGGIEIPIVTCNDVEAEFKAGNQFKLYIEADTKLCKGYGKGSVPNACAEACQEQYTECQSVYAQGCKAYNNRRSGGGYSSAPDIAKRFFFADTFTVALNKCKVQYQDCLAENKNVLVSNKCGVFAGGY